VIVMKFGGTSLESAERMLAVAGIVRERAAGRPLVVASALGGVTTLLDQAIRAALADDRESLERHLADLERRHRWALAGTIESATRRHHLSLELDGMFEDLRGRLRSIRILGEGTARASDRLLAFGETLSSSLLAGVLVDQGLPARWVDARDIVVTDNRFGAASPNLEATRVQARAKLLPRLEAGEIPVLGGFVGADAAGDTTTLGRGGSDTSATVLGHALDAEEVQIWTDVDGLLTADPHWVPAARTQPDVSYAEAAELAFYGARVLHPASIAPAVQKGIALRVLNSLRPERPGTRVGADDHASRRGPLAAVASRAGVTRLRVTSRRMRMDPDFLPAVTRAFSQEQLVPDLLLSSEVAVSAVLPALADPESLERRLAPIARLELAADRAVICVVGRGLDVDAACRVRVLAALAEWRPELVALGASETSAAAVVPASLLGQAIPALHRSFFDEEVTS